MALALMLYAFSAACVCAGVVTAIEVLLRRSLCGSRWLWATAIFGTVAFVAIAPFRGPPADAPPSSLRETAAHLNPARVPSQESLSVRWLRRVPAWASRTAGGLWVISSVLTCLAFGLTFHRYRRAVSKSRGSLLCGETVCVDTALGPAVIGIAPPRIVIPFWLLSRPQKELELVIRHEREHIQAHDPMLQLAACFAVALLPWNPGMWYMLDRLNRAVELDCDKRVLAAGTSAADYGSLLIDLAVRPYQFGQGSPAFVGRTSHLQHRLEAMFPQAMPLLWVRFGVAGALVFLVIVAAHRTVLARVLPPHSTTVGANWQTPPIVPSVGAVLLRPEAAAEVRGKIDTRYRPESTTHSSGLTPVVFSSRVPQRDLGEEGGSSVRVPRAPIGIDRVLGRQSAESRDRKFDGLLLVNGIPRKVGALREIDVADVETLEIVKGESAIRTYGDMGRQGVILIATKQE